MGKISLEQFRAEVSDKLGVVFNGCHALPLQRAISRKQCEDFLVERYAEALAEPPAREEPIDQALRLAQELQIVMEKVYNDREARRGWPLASRLKNLERRLESVLTHPALADESMFT